MLVAFTRPRSSVVRRLLVAVGAGFFIVAGTGATLPSKFGLPQPGAPTIQASTQDTAPPKIGIVENLSLPSYGFQFTGFVGDPANNVGGLTVTVSGPGLPNDQTSVDLGVLPVANSTSNGAFELVVQLEGNTTNSPITYEWTAVASDGNGRVSEPVSWTITLQPLP
jgi:hypothetical protein